MSDVFPSGIALGLTFVALFVQALLLRQEQTRFIRFLRIALFPLSLYLQITIPLRNLFYPKDRWVFMNLPMFMMIHIGCARAFEFAFSKKPYKWIGLDAAFSVDAKEKALNGPDIYPRGWWNDCIWAFSLCTTSRGVGWNWGCTKDDLPPLRSTKLSTFLKSIIGDIILHQIIGTASIAVAVQYHSGYLTEWLHKQGLEGVGHHYTQRFILAMTEGFGAWAALAVDHAQLGLYHCLIQTALSSLPLPSAVRPPPFDTRSYPPLLQTPFDATSLHEFWTKRWHALFRRMFRYFGYSPLYRVFRPFGKFPARGAGVLGAFVISGLMHEHAFEKSSTRPKTSSRPASLIFFVSHAVGMTFETLFKRITGRRVTGLVGRIWFWSFMVITGMPIAQDWLDKGMASSVPPVAEWEWWRFIGPMWSIMPASNKQ